MDTSRFPQLIDNLYSVVEELERMFDRRFTPDGHLVGSIGEALASYYYGLKLSRPSTKGYDATLDGKKIEIKATQSDRVAFRCKPEHLLVLKLEKNGSFNEIYNGYGGRVWEQVEHKKMPKNGQHQVSLATLRRLAKEVQDVERIKRLL